MSNMFTNCSIISLDLSNFDTSNVENMENMFGGCSNLLSLNLSNFNTSKVRDMGGMFLSCSNLLSLDLSNFDTSSVIDMGYMFNECNKLISLNIENFDTSKVNRMNYMFSQCYELSSLDLSSFDTSLVTITAYMFNNCSKITSLNLSIFNLSSVNSMACMFNGCKELKYLDISNFKALSATIMRYMFYGCEKLTSLNLSNFNTKKATNMEYMFYNCKELKTLDISNFNTSLVQSMQYIFSGCNSLVSLDISNFDLIKISKIDYMFSNCSSLVYLNLNINKINNKIRNKTDIFNGISEDLKFCTNEITGSIFVNELNKTPQCTDNCFKKNAKLIVEKKECVESCHLDADYQYEYNNLCYDNCLANTHKSSIDEFLCEDDLVCKNYHNLDKSECFDEILEGYYLKDPLKKTLDKCHEDCKTCDKKETENNTNCNSCKNNKFLYFGNCVDSCIHGYEIDEFGKKICKCSSDGKCKEYTKESSELNLCTNCNDDFYKKINDETNIEYYFNCYKDPEGYYLDLQNSIYKPCYESCHKCDRGGTKAENNCLTCKSNYSFNIFEKENNCYQNCDYYYYFDESNEYQCTKDENCPQNQSKLILEKNKCIDECKNDDIYINEYNNICYETCPNGYVLKKNIYIEETEEIETDKNTDNESIENTETEETYKNIDNGTVENTNSVIKTAIDKETETQNSLLNCRAKELFIKKSCGVDISNPTNKEQLISNIQNDIINHKLDDLINNITETKQDLEFREEDIIYQITTTENQNKNIYNNISCVKLGDCEDRLRDIYGIGKNMSLIIFKMDYFSPGLLMPIIGYEVYHPISKEKLNLNYCNDVSIDISYPVNINEEELFKYDPSNEFYSDICISYSTEFQTDITIKDRKEEYINKNLTLCEEDCNFSNYDVNNKKVTCECYTKLSFPIISEIKINKDKLKRKFKNIKETINLKIMKCYKLLFTKEGIVKNFGNNILLFIILVFIISTIIFTFKSFNVLCLKIKKIYSEKNNNNNNKLTEGYNHKTKKIIKRKIKKKSKKNTSLLKRKKNIISNLDLIENKKIIKKKKSKILGNNNKNKNYIMIVYNDNELNMLQYKEALIYDKRSYCQYYLSLLKTKHIIIFTFCNSKDYNSMVIKICLLFFSFSLHYMINALFFNDSTIHIIYLEKGEFNFIYQLPQIIYSNLIFSIINLIIKYFSLVEKNILEFKNDQPNNNLKTKMEKLIKLVKIKIFLFYIISYIFLLFFWYYLSCFCAVYKNTQVYLIKDTILSFGLSLIYPLGLYLIPGIFRILSIKSKNNGKKYMFKLSRYIEFLL